MGNFLGDMNFGLVLLSTDLRVIGLNDHARRVFKPALGELGKSLFDYHPDKSKDRVRGLLREMAGAPPGEARTVVIDVLGKAIMNNLSKLTIASPVPQNCLAVTFIDVTEQTGAAKNPLSGLVEMKRIPVADGGSCRFLPVDDVFCIQSDGDYCKIFTSDKSHYVHLNLKTMLQRYPCAAWFRVHKSYAVNIRRINKMVRSEADHLTIILDGPNTPQVPVSRRKAAELKKAVATL